jgi:hypothetical protein
MRTFIALRRWTIAFSLAALLSITVSERLAAQDQPDQDDPPTRVARLSYLQGAVSFQPAGESDWVDAVLNRPMTTGDQLWTDRDSRAELGLGTTIIDLSSNTGVSLLNLDNDTIQVQLSSGVIEVRVRRMRRDDDIEIDTPNQAFTINEAGRYRIEASPDGSYTVVSVFDGEGASTGNGSTYTIYGGQRVTLEGTDQLNAQTEDIYGPDDFDNWAYNRYQRYENSMSARYVSDEMVGYADLDSSGDWQPAMGYGTVWFPHVAAGWAPYHEGHWAWVDPWGWTWVDDAPWGYAPFHYGRWVSVGGRWGWIPGPREVAPVYAPALVVFIGGGPAGFGGNVGWFPLGPREVYVPSYRVSRGYFSSINVSNTTVTTTNITNVYNTTIIRNETSITNVTYANRNVAGAVTAVPQRAFVSAQPVGRAAVAVNAREIASMPVATRAAVAPTANSVLGARANTANHVAAPPAAIASRAIVAKKTPPPPPVSFASREKAMAANPGQALPRKEVAAIRPANATPAARPQIKQAPPARPATAVVKPGAHPPGAPGNRPGAPAANQKAAPATQPAPSKSQAPPPLRPPTAQQNNRPVPPPARAEQPQETKPANRPEPPKAEQKPAPPRPEANRPTPPPQRNEPAARPAPPPKKEAPPQKKDEERKKEEKPPR